MKTCKSQSCLPSLFAGSLRPIIPNIEHTYRRYNVALFYKVQSSYSEEAESLSHHESMTVTGSSPNERAQNILYSSCLMSSWWLSSFFICTNNIINNTVAMNDMSVIGGVYLLYNSEHWDYCFYIAVQFPVWPPVFLSPEVRNCPVSSSDTSIS